MPCLLLRIYHQSQNIFKCFDFGIGLRTLVLTAFFRNDRELIRNLLYKFHCEMMPYVYFINGCRNIICLSGKQMGISLVSPLSLHTHLLTHTHTYIQTYLISFYYITIFITYFNFSTFIFTIFPSIRFTKKDLLDKIIRYLKVKKKN